MNEFQSWRGHGLAATPFQMSHSDARVALPTRKEQPTRIRCYQSWAGHGLAEILRVVFSLSLLQFPVDSDLAATIKQVAYAGQIVGIFAPASVILVHIAKNVKRGSFIGTMLTSVGWVVQTEAFDIFSNGVVTTGRMTLDMKRVLAQFLANSRGRDTSWPTGL
jgi:hypothetical protein